MSEVDALTLPDARDLVGYWRERPPPHIVLRAIGEFLGAWEPVKASAGTRLASEEEILGFIQSYKNAAPPPPS